MPTPAPIPARPSGRAPTLHDIAARAGVSVRTASRVVNDRAGPAAATRARVLEVIADLGYRPNLMARGLVTRQSFTLGLVATYLIDPFFAELARGIQVAGERYGYLVYLTSSEGDADKQQQVIQSLVDRGCDGLIVFPVRGTQQQLRELADRAVPVVTIDYLIDHPRIGSVESATERGSHIAVEHLRSRGRHQLGMISSPSSETVDEPREHGFREAIAANGATDPRDHVVWADETMEGGAHGVRRLLDRFADLDGVLAYNDIMAIGAMRALEDLGHHVPNDIAVIGVDDVAVSALVRPALTTIRLDREQMGARAVDMLMRMRADPNLSPGRETVDVTLTIRNST
ncbi:MAG TPA: LacI family DNA-binding transcriptional regulator [Ilumatobacteraceae bacterium]|nr:LacI family DNA-binding transcriptional regulator [Ilumatobacteraceae bacterium]